MKLGLSIKSPKTIVIYERGKCCAEFVEEERLKMTEKGEHVKKYIRGSTNQY